MIQMRKRSSVLAAVLAVLLALPFGALAAGVSQEDYALLAGFDLTAMNDTVAVQIPSGWGSNAGVSDQVISYSPTNRSGAMDVASGTVSTYWTGDGPSGSGKLEEYVSNIRKADFYSDVTSEPFSVAGQEGLALSYTMNINTHSFYCKSACFVYDDVLYAVELAQGDSSREDYSPVYETVVGSEAVMEGLWDLDRPAPETGETPAPVPAETPVPEETSAPEPAETPVPAETSAPEPEETPEPEPDEPLVPDPDEPPGPEETSAPGPEETPVPEPGRTASADIGDDLGSFTYAINGHSYSFPTRMSDLAEDDLQVDYTLELSAERSAAAEGDALVNTLYFMLAAMPDREMIGVTNLTGKIAPMREGVLTALVDTKARAVALELPGGVRVGGTEDSVIAAFPEFASLGMDGEADIRGDDLIYGTNVRGDGCNGYLLIRDDRPYCSALSIVCEDGVIREINFQCLGEEVAETIFSIMTEE